MISSRQQQILRALIQEYIDTANPVGSGVLFSKHALPVSAATIRNELAELMEEGFLSQPHTSAGRIPTDKAYRFFIDYLIDESEFADHKRLERMIASFISEDVDRISRELARTVSYFSRGLGISLAEGTGRVYKEGVSQLVSQWDVRDSEILREFFSIFERLEYDVEYIFDRLLTEEVRVFVGEENPISKSDNFSIISMGTKVEERDEVVALIGPKHMDYAYNLSLFSELNRILSHV